MEERTPDEIDLIDVLKRLIKAIRGNLNALTLILTLSFSVSIALRYGLRPTYQSQMIVRSDILTEPFTNNIALSINNLIKTKSFDEIQSKLSLADDETRAVKSIKIESLVEKKQSELQDTTQSFFLITAEVTNNLVFPKLQVGLLNYIENNGYVKVRVEQRKQYYKRYIEKIDQELKALDSLKGRVTKGQVFLGSGSSIVFFDPTNVYDKSITMFRDKMKLEQSLQLASSIQVIEGFSIPNKPSSPGLMVYVPAGLGVGILLFCFYLMIKGLIWLSKQED